MKDSPRRLGEALGRSRSRCLPLAAGLSERGRQAHWQYEPRPYLDAIKSMWHNLWCVVACKFFFTLHLHVVGHVIWYRHRRFTTVPASPCP